MTVRVPDLFGGRTQMTAGQVALLVPVWVLAVWPFAAVGIDGLGIVPGSIVGLAVGTILALLVADSLPDPR